MKHSIKTSLYDGFMKFVIGCFLITAWGLVCAPQAPAGEEKDEVIERLKQLEERIAELERLLSEPRERSMPMHRRGWEPQPFSDAWDPWAMWERMQKRMQRMLEEAQKDFGDWSVQPFRVKTDIQEKKDKYIITMDLPGMEQDQIDVKVQKGLLIVSGQRQKEEAVQDDVHKYYRQERSFGYFNRVLALPEDADPTGMKTEYKNGVLTILLPKKGKSII